MQTIIVIELGLIIIALIHNIILRSQNRKLSKAIDKLLDLTINHSQAENILKELVKLENERLKKRSIFQVEEQPEEWDKTFNKAREIINKNGKTNTK